jgi:hypothetical protein
VSAKTKKNVLLIVLLYCYSSTVPGYALCSNDKALQSITIAISKMVRYNNQSLLDWLQSFIAPINKYMKANGVANLDADEAKTI